MKKRFFVSFLSLMTAVSVLLTSLSLTNSLSVSAADENGIKVETTADLPVITEEAASDYANGSYSYEAINLYSAAEAAAAGVPEGYSDNVWKLTALTSQGTNVEAGVVVDFTSSGIKVGDIESMTIRYYVDSDCKAVRLATNKNWILNTTKIQNEQWTEITVNDGFGNFMNNADGTLGKVALCFRYGYTFYVDSITFQLSEHSDSIDDKDIFENPIGRDEIPYATDGRPSFDKYKYDRIAVYTAEEAAAADVPEGYSDHVMMLTGTSEVGIAMDFTDWNIPLGLVRSMTFRVYVPKGIAEVRLANQSEWIVRHTPSEKNAWIDITLYPDGKGFSNSNFMSILNDNQTLGSFHFCLRYPNGVSGTAYIDGFSFDLRENDGVAPVIQYKGSTTIKTSADKPFVLQDLIAYDEQEERYITPALTWSNGALDEKGLLNKGTHTCDAVFSDYYGNASEKTLQVEVGDKDTEAPTIRFNLSTIHATAGTRVDLAKTIVVTDNYDVVSPVLTWSDGAVDAQNLLQVGTHTLTITATDLTGLQSQKTVKFIVTDKADTPATPTPVN